MRRRALLGCALSAAIAGCTDGDSGDDRTDADNDENGSEGGDGTDSGSDDDDEPEVGESRYRVVVEAPEPDPGERSVCEFESLPDAAREEFEAAIDGVDFETDSHGHYTSTESPAILDTDCYNVYIAYKSEYYWVGVDVEGG